MSNKGKFMDRTSFMREAGITTAIDGENVTNCFNYNHINRVQTPDHLKRYRQSERHIPGAKQTHYGIYNDPKPYESMIHGIKTKESDHVDNCIKDSNKSGINYFVNQIKESKYSSNQREPLGKSIIRNYDYPEKYRDASFRYGIPTSGYYNCKDVLYNGQFDEPEHIKELYNKTHGLTDPGQQKDRKYNWPVDKNNHVFGKPDPVEFDGAKASLRTDFLESDYPKTIIQSKRLEDFRQATSDMLGRPKFRGTLNPNIDDNHIFGKKTVVGDNWNVAKCISGDPEPKEMFEDSDLGKSTLYRSKLKSVQPQHVDPEKTFGVPSVRVDLNRTKSSLADNNNYGGEKDAYELLYPNPHVFKGLDDPDFEELLEKEQLLNSKGYNFPNEELDVIYEIGLKMYPNNQNKLTYNQFITLIRHLKSEYMKYRTLF